MNAESSMFQAIGLWVPLVVSIITIAFAARILRSVKVDSNRNHYSNSWRSAISASKSSSLGAAIEDALSLNSFSTNSINSPGVRLQSIVRFAPHDFSSAAGAICRNFRDGNVISIDMGTMEHSQASRLVDFVSGMTGVTSGSIFRITDNVIVLTPGAS